jgi:hypothetical protein
MDDVSIVERHRLWQTPYRKSLRPKALAQIRLLAGEQILVEPADTGEVLAAHERDATTRTGITGRPSPLTIAHAVVDGPLGEALVQPTAYTGYVTTAIEKLVRFLEPAVN